MIRKILLRGAINMGFPEAGWMMQVAEGQQRLLKLAEEAAGVPSPCFDLVLEFQTRATQHTTQIAQISSSKLKRRLRLPACSSLGKW